MKLVYNFDGDAVPMWLQLTFWLLYMLVFAYAFKKTVLSWHKSSRFKDVTWLFAIFFTLFTIFYCVNDDYFQYREWLDVPSLCYWGKEKFYFYAILLCRSLQFDYPYELFRLIVWGGAVFIAYYTFRMYRRLMLPGLALLLLFVFHAGSFSYARASLAMAVYFFGIAMVLRHNGSIPKLLGIGIALSSYYFHHELLIAIAALPFLFLSFEKKSSSVLSIILLVIVIYAVSFIGSNLQFLDEMFDNDDLTSRIENINEKGQGTFRFSTLINYLKYFYPFYLITKYFWKKKVPKSIAGMYRITCGILMLSIAFMVVYGLRSVYTYRVLYMAMIPLTLLIDYGFCHGYFKKRHLLLMLLLAVLSNSIRFINA